jgi:hypothetical protein
VPEDRVSAGEAIVVGEVKSGEYEVAGNAWLLP